MDWYVRAFIRASLVWLGVGMVIGVFMAWSPAAIAYRPAHVHANLLGFVTMMIYGVGYHVLPRFAGRKLHSPQLATVHVWVANAGLLGMVAGFVIRVKAVAGWEILVGGGGFLSAVGCMMFISNIWRSLNKAPVSITGTTNARMSA